MREVFTDSYMRKRLYMAWRKDIVSDAIIRTLSPESVIDVGCGPGEFVLGLWEKGVKSCGIDSSPEARKVFLASPERFILADITDSRLPVTKKFSLCLCFELLRFISKRRRDQLVKNLVQLSDQLLLTAAPEELKWIQEKVLDFGYIQDENIVRKIKQILEPVKRKMAVKSLYYNLMFLKRGQTS